MILEEATLQARLLEIVFAPLENPEILPEVLPLAIGALVIELYFGKHKRETLGWNTSVGNAILWVATGANLILTGAVKTSMERYAAYFLVASGAFVGYMDFYHKWSPSVAFRVSSADVIYPLAYVIVVIVKTEIPVEPVSLQAGATLIVGVVIAFHLLRMVETPAREFRFQR
ncbi:MAG: hypothetical protein ABEJ91_00245 [Candidatus Nanohaloarchaea archaeon]